jgi:two-component system sensor histidine kinase KdpD
MSRGTLRLYLGAAPGVGKTYAMLNEGWRRKERGTDVVIGWVQEHGRPQTDAQIRDLEVFPRRTVDYRGQTFEEMDTEGLIERKPTLVLVDELAHSNMPGSTHAKRWQDVEDLLEAGINVISNLNLQHLESLNDVVGRITGVEQRETVPDPFVRSADQIELVDMAPEALRRRMAHGNIYPPERIDTALANYFRPGNLIALRELALLWVADRVDEELTDYRERHHIAGPWETRERVLVSVTGARGSAELIRRAARMAMRTKAELIGVHVRTDETITQSGSEGLVANRALLDDLGGRYVEVVGADVADALVSVARSENATQLIMGATHRSRITELARGSVINSVIRAAGGSLDVHVIATDERRTRVSVADKDRPPPATIEGDVAHPGDTEGRHRHVSVGRWRTVLTPVSMRRQATALLIGLAGFPLLTLILTANRSHVGLSTALSAYLILVIAIAVVGGVGPALLGSVAGFLLLNWYFSPPIHTFTIADTRDIAALVMFLLTAGVVSVLVDISARRTEAANRARADARMLARAAGRMLASEGDPLPALLGELTIAFRVTSASILRNVVERNPFGVTSATDAQGRDRWTTVAAVGDQPPLAPVEATAVVPLTDREVLALSGRPMSPGDREILTAFAAQLATALTTGRLHDEAAAAETEVRGLQLGSGLLAAVGHDLRTPLAAIKVASSSLLSDHLSFGPDETRTLLQTIDEEADRLSGLVENLLDLSRLRTRTLEVLDRPVDVADLIEAAVVSASPEQEPIVTVPEDLAPVRTDPFLVERALANLIDNAVRHGGSESVRIEAGAVPVAGRVDIRIVDRGPGIPRQERERVFEPFHRTASGDVRSGVGLGLTVARGFIEAVGGRLEIEDTPGGGCTAVVRLPVVPHGGADGRVGEPPPDELQVVDDVDMVHEELDELDDTPGRRTSPWVSEMPEQAADAGNSEPAPAGAPASVSDGQPTGVTSDPAGSAGDH